MKTVLVEVKPWPKEKKVREYKPRAPRPNPRIFKPKPPLAELDYFREAIEQLAEIKRKKATNEQTK